MKQELRALLTAARDRLVAAGDLPAEGPDDIPIERTRDSSHGDFASPVALAMAKAAKRKPRAIAEALVGALPASESVDAIDIAGPGFINFRLSPRAYHRLIGTILRNEDFVAPNIGGGERVQIEFVSANPTGPLHVGHGRGAAFGATLGNLLAAVGFDVQREYYVNDAGRQMDILAVSIWIRYLELFEPIAFPSNGYLGDYIVDIAREAKAERADLVAAPSEVWADLDALDDDEKRMDALIARAKSLLGNDKYRWLFDRGINTILDDIRSDLEAFGVHYDAWFSERSLEPAMAPTIERLARADHIYEKDGAQWFRSTAFGDDKDRVVIRDNGQGTYFASDIAYHANKLERGFSKTIDIWGADHHGYIARVKGALSGLGEDPDRLLILLVQFANLFRAGEKVAMTTRGGQFVTLRELREEVGNDAARFFYVMRKCDQHLDFDLDLAKSKSNDNPVYYIQYAHARIASVLRELNAKGWSWSLDSAQVHFERLTEGHETALLRTLSRYPEVLETAARDHEPHQLAFYLRDLANDFHTYYNAHQFLVDDEAMRNARIGLISATQRILARGLAILGVSAPDEM